MQPNNCKNCNLFFNEEEKRLNWLEEVSMRNVELLKTVQEQEEIITILNNKIIDKNHVILTEHSSKILEHMEELTLKINKILEHKNNSNIHSTEIILKLKENIKKLNVIIDGYENEKEEFKKLINEKELANAHHTLYQNGMVNYYRETLMNEMREYTDLKMLLKEKIDDLDLKNKNVAKTYNQEKSVCAQLNKKYKTLLQQNSMELKNKEKLIENLCSNRRNLYLKISELKKENKEKDDVYKEEIRKLKSQIVKLKLN